MESQRELKVHPLIDLFPMMSEEELADLAEDIKANGLIYPIVIDGDVLIDGRNRLAVRIYSRASSLSCSRRIPAEPS
jgi:disulfide oxidoreductase YuzD